ncbi:hypothetical protein P8C59_006160 [Phyllachora maydis]|uniref:Uncharacterized protein n=1 Tax=Phyllachora maydis TaxID=1825666 RepID=A0AAD9MGC3_9PEZI|nr:hypothetical protein P8C59_006160 [Phyllachora maydis]
MPKKKSQPDGEGNAEHDTMPMSWAPGPGAKKATSSSATPTSAAPSTALIICRNKHWRYISSFHGPWLSLPLEMLETLANINYNTPRPRPIDPTVFFELVKIRRLVDEATELAVRAATDSTASTADILPASLHQYFGRSGFSSGNQPKLSRERKYRMRDQATQKLSKAYHLDEIACSVATMQSTSALEDVASLVLQRKADHTDAKCFVAQHRGGRRQEDIVLKEDEQPSSLEIQLLFQRASVYLNLACTKVHAALPEPVPTPQAASSSPAPIAAQQAAFEAQKAVKQNAKRALRDYMAFLAHFEYTPDLPIDIADDFSRRGTCRPRIANGKAGVLFAASVRSSNPVEGPSNVDHEKAVEVKGEDGAKDLAETAAGTATNGLGKLMQSKLDAGVAVRTKPAIPPPSKPTAKAGATHGDANTGPRGRAAFEEYPVVTERANAVARWVREAPPHAGLVAPDGTRRRKKKPTKKAAALDRPAYKGPLSLAVNDGRIGGSAD